MNGKVILGLAGIAASTIVILVKEPKGLEIEGKLLKIKMWFNKKDEE